MTDTTTDKGLVVRLERLKTRYGAVVPLTAAVDEAVTEIERLERERDEWRRRWREVAKTAVAKHSPAEDAESRLSRITAPVDWTGDWNGCPLCKYEDNVLVEPCAAHEKMDRMSSDASIDRSIIDGQASILKQLQAIIKWDDDDDPAEIAQGRMDELASAEEELARITAPVEGMGLETTEEERAVVARQVELMGEGTNASEVAMFCPDDSVLRRLLNDLETLSARLRVAEEALEPFADAVFNDNGDVTFDHTTYSSDDLWKAYSVLRRAASIRARGES